MIWLFVFEFGKLMYDVFKFYSNQNHFCLWDLEHEFEEVGVGLEGRICCWVAWGINQIVFGQIKKVQNKFVNIILK